VETEKQKGAWEGDLEVSATRWHSS